MMRIECLPSSSQLVHAEIGPKRYWHKLFRIAEPEEQMGVPCLRAVCLWAGAGRTPNDDVTGIKPAGEN